ncbi:MAG: IS481 family transposase [Edaphobacter sp.]
MDYHYHARLTIYSREQLAKDVIEGRLSLREAAAECRLSRQTAAKWVQRYRQQGVAGLADRSSRPHLSPRATSQERVMGIERLRRERWTGVRIAQQLGLSHATVSRVLRRLKLNRIRDLEPQPAIVRYEHPVPGDLLHFDIKRLVRIQRPSHRVTGDRRDSVKGIGAEYLHIAIDDHSRIAFTAMYPDQTESSATHFLYSAIAWYARLGIDIRRVLTDNGACYKAHRFRSACGDLGIQPKRTRPYTPRTNGKAERFIQTALREWAYARIYQNSEQRTAALLCFNPQYNWHRPHASLNQMPPISRARLDVNNLLRHHT